MNTFPIRRTAQLTEDINEETANICPTVCPVKSGLVLLEIGDNNDGIHPSKDVGKDDDVESVHQTLLARDLLVVKQCRDQLGGDYCHKEVQSASVPVRRKGHCIHVRTGKFPRNPPRARARREKYNVVKVEEYELK